MLTRLLASLRVILVITALVAAGELMAPAAAAHAQDSPAPTGAWLPGAGPSRFTFTLRSPGAVLVTLGDLTADLRLSVLAGGREVAVSDRPGTTFEEVQIRLPAGRHGVGVGAGHTPVPEDARFRLLIRPIDDRLLVLDAHTVSGGGLYAITGQLLNNSRGWRAYPRVTARFHGRDGSRLGQATALAAQNRLAPGARGHFRLVADPPAGTVRYTLAVDAPPTPTPAHPTLTVRPDVPYLLDSGKLRYVGRIAGDPARSVRVHVVRYNRIGAFVDAGQAVLGDVGPGERARYEVELPRYPYLSDTRLSYSAD
jgi:hypothetical protein